MHESERSPFHADLIVVGGGLAGLSAATLVAQAGRSVIVCEQASSVGGRAVTHVDQGVHFNLGAHALYCRGHAFGLFKKLGIPFTGKYPSPGRGLVFLGETSHRLPRGMGSLLGSRLLTTREKWRFARLMINLPGLNARRCDGVSLRDWVESTVGVGRSAALLRALFRLSTYVDDHERLSAGVAIDQLRLALDGNVWYLDGGWQTLVDGLRAKALEHGAQVSTGAGVKAVRSDEHGVSVQTSDGETLRGRAAVLAVPPKTVCDLLDLPADAPLSRWTTRCVPVKAACLDVALSRLPVPRQRFALGLDRPFYFSVHSAAARLAPEGVEVLHLIKYLGGSTSVPAPAVEHELELFLDRIQPGWQANTIARRFLPGMTVSHSLPRADLDGLAGRPAVSVCERPHVFLAGDWVGPAGMLADASAASAESAAQSVLAALARARVDAGREPLHVAT